MMKNQWMRRIALFCLTALFAVLGAATSQPPADETANEESDESDESEPTAPTTLSALESTLVNAEAHGSGPGAEILADSLHETWGGLEDQSLAVQVIPGDPEHIVVVMRDNALADYGANEREETLNSLGAVLDTFGATRSHVALGLRGRMFFGATAVREPGGRWQLETGESVSHAVLDAAMTASPVATGRIRRVEYGRISMEDELFQDVRADRYPLELTAGAVVTITMDSPDLDCFVHLLAPSGEEVASNDDDPEGDTLGSRLQHTVTESGNYTVIASQLADDVGNYAVRIASDPTAAAAESP